MRAYFLNLLNNLDKLAGLKQLDKIHALYPGNKEAVKKEINELLDACCNASSLFPFIPEEDQQKILTHFVITEEFPSLNAAMVYKALNRQKDKYYKESHHIEKQSDPPLTGEARQKKLAEWLEALNATPVAQSVAPLENHEISNEKRKMQSTIEWLKEKPKDWQIHRKSSADELNAHDLHLEWIRENYHPHTAKPIEGWIPEKEWLEKRNKK